MRRITLWMLSTVAAVVLLFSYRTSTMGATAPNAPGVVGAAPGLVPNGPAAGGPAGSAAPSGATLVNGTVAQTRWGPVQVRVTISGGRITDVVALQVPSGNRRDREINDYAVPMLREKVLQAQSADIDSVSGATVTSDGYRRSLQAALDAAHFGS
ncbi:FMN-binding protein [Dactylosporangium sucinum]|uniref:FMN-binding protein n=1 Tax=Dactylosporangium sucinum TaxID=1424081 RepID=A0A917WQL0_9ACTN|nr:FMN-binding protein [Dactylosporangium sucinum]GGM20956.1 FMN-binding protein [Dactylosporangium sucinum]